MPDTSIAALPSRIDPRIRAALWAGPVVVLALVLMAAVPPESHAKPLEYFTIGVVFGTFFAQAMLAAAWTALGPLPLIWRLPLSLAWLAASVVALAMNITINGPRGDYEVAVVFGVVALGQWLVAQAPLWGMAVGYGLRVRHASESSPGQDRKERQFAIRQLLIVTTIVAVVLGIGRAVVLAVVSNTVIESGPIIIISFLAIAGLVMTLPLILAALLPRHALPASLVVLVLIGLGTATELPLLTSLHPAAGGGPHIGHFFAINGFQCFWILAVIGALRRAGYSLTAACSPALESRV
ncbi:MAG: hypothetical protein L0211_02715 [Planctomycetaceae bacterium]|nr:hypothetical protein [Planctomycetaceae bacterium]